MESVFTFRKNKMFLLCIGCLLFVALTLRAILFSMKSGIAGLLVRISWVTANLLFFGAGFLWTLRALLSPQKPRTIVSEQGIMDNAAAFSAGFIPWNAIHSIAAGPVVTITVKDFEPSPTR